MKSRLKRIFLWLCVDLFGGLFRLIGLADILRKFQTVEDSRKHPVGFLGAVGIFALFGLADQPYQGERDRLISRVDQIRGGAFSGDQNRWLKQTAPAQSGETRTAPVFWPPGQTARSFFGVKEKNPGITRRQIEIAEAKRDDLAGAKLAGHNFKRADLEGAYLRGADLTETIISGARFDEAENLACGQLESARFKKETSIFGKETIIIFGGMKETIFPSYLNVSWNEYGAFLGCRPQK